MTEVGVAKIKIEEKKVEEEDECIVCDPFMRHVLIQHTHDQGQFSRQAGLIVWLRARSCVSDKWQISRPASAIISCCGFKILTNIGLCMALFSSMCIYTYVLACGMFTTSLLSPAFMACGQFKCLCRVRLLSIGQHSDIHICGPL